MHDATPNQKSISAETVRSFAAECLRYMKLEKDASILIADSLIYSDLWGTPFMDSSGCSGMVNAFYQAQHEYLMSQNGKWIQVGLRF